MRHLISWPSPILLTSPRVRRGGPSIITKQDPWENVFFKPFLCVFPNTATLIDPSLQDWILISRQLPKQPTTEQTIRITVGIIKMPLHSNIVSPSLAPTHSWFSLPTKKQLYEQQASVCELPSVVSFTLVPSRSGKLKHTLCLISVSSSTLCIPKQYLKSPQAFLSN